MLGVVALFLFVALVILSLYLVEFSSMARHYDRLVRESSQLEKDIEFNKSQLDDLKSKVSYYRNCLDDLHSSVKSRRSSKR